VAREIYEGLREALSADTLFMGRLATAVRTGDRREAHQKQVVDLFLSRVRQALPNVARHILSEWGEEVLNEEQGREAKRQSAKSRVEVSGGGQSPKGRVLPRVNYRKMTDMDILDL
jgi:nucleoid DNA-binding protein